ncbi:MAG: hypothetical protein ACRCSN_12630, partial [Dermatophilaceae bacterium]
MLLLTAALAVVVAPAVASAEDDPPTNIRSWNTSTGSRLSGTQTQPGTSTGSRPAGPGRPGKPGPGWEYKTVAICTGRAPSSADALGNFCSTALTACQGLPMNRPGTAVNTYRRRVDATGRPAPGAPGQWGYAGLNCTQDAPPGGRPVLTMAMIRSAFRDTAFATAGVNIQPEGDLTLVNLPTWFQTVVQGPGYGPNETRTVTLLGTRVQIRPVLATATYHLGASTVIGPTSSLGGPHPDGDIVAKYPSAGAYPARTDITYTGQFRLPGGAWTDIPGQVTITGAPTTLTVKEARARLVAPGNTAPPPPRYPGPATPA